MLQCCSEFQANQTSQTNEIKSNRESNRSDQTINQDQKNQKDSKGQSVCQFVNTINCRVLQYQQINQTFNRPTKR